MDLAVPELAVEFAASVRKRLEAEGGVELCRRAETDPASREHVGEVLTRLGVWDLDPRADLDQAMTAAEVVRAAGAVALPYPVVGRLLARGPSWLAVVRDGISTARVEHGDLTDSWVLAGLDGTASTASALRSTPGQKLAPFVGRGEIGPRADVVPGLDVALWLTLDSFWLLGAAETALQRTVDHLLARQQFGRPLAAFQAVRFRVAECVTLLEGLRALGRFTVWHHLTQPADALADAFAVRTVALEAVPAVFAAAHQFHGAIGLTAESDVTLLHRHAQGHLRLPVGYDDLGRLLVREVELQGFESLFGRFQGGPMTGADR